MMTWSMAHNIRTVPEIDIGSFPQGISIHTPDNIFGLKAQWTVLVLLQKPTPDPRINSIIHHLKNIVSSNNVPLDSAIKRNWIRRLRWISEVIQVNKVTRSKRSILPFVGSLSNILFGTVTEDQLNQYRKAVNRALISTNQTIHIVNSLITVTKHIQLQAKENQHRITNLATFLQNFTYTVSNEFQIMHNTLQKLVFQVNFEHLMVSLEQAVYFYTRQLDAYHTQRRSLENQQLTEDVLPTTELVQILHDAGKLKYYAPHPTWYFTNVKITPLWKDDQALIYHAILPFHDGESYIRYTLHSFPLPVAPGIFSQLKLEKDIAMNTATGHMLILQDCTGTGPTICSTGALFRNFQFPCERAIITHDESLRPHCLVSIFHSNKPILKQAGPGRYILSTHSTQIRKNCAGKPERMQILKQGVFYIKLNNSCAVKTDNWTIKGIYHVQETKHISIRPIVTDLTSPLLDRIPQLPLNPIQTLPKWTTINHLLALNITKQEPLPYMSYVQESPSDTGYTLGSTLQL